MNNHDSQVKELQHIINSAKDRLYKKLVNLDLAKISISEYNQRYLTNYISNLKNVLDTYGRLLSLSCKSSETSFENCILVDYGGGSGLISYLAKEAGFKTVVYCDIYNISCKDVGVISGILETQIDHIVCGDVRELVQYLKENEISIDAVVSYDVLEHIYDVETHFKQLSLISDKEFKVVYASAANIANPRYVHWVKKKQYEAEYLEKEKKWGFKDGNSLPAYFEIRKKIIKEYAPILDDLQIEMLATNTRGLITQDIEKCVNEFNQKGEISYIPLHPSNTCDPYTGNWCEQLLDFSRLEMILKNEGFEVKIIPGVYNINGSLPKKILKGTLNMIINKVGFKGMALAPYYIVLGVSRKND